MGEAQNLKNNRTTFSAHIYGLRFPVKKKKSAPIKSSFSFILWLFLNIYSEKYDFGVHSYIFTSSKNEAFFPC